MSDVDEGVRPTLLVIHRDDDDARAILDEVAAQVELGNATQHLRIQIDSATPEDSALWNAEVIRSDGVIEEHQLFTYLSDIGTQSMLRFVAVCAKSADYGMAAELNDRMRNLRERMPMLLGTDYPRTQARISIVGYGDEQVDARFFSALADANLTVIPLDRLQDASIARPVLRSQIEAFHVHGAVELISATGLWRTMGDAPIDHVRGGPAGGSEPRVRFVQSRMRLLRTPAVPIASLVAEDRELPMPDGFLQATNAIERIGRAAEQLLPPEFVYVPSQPPAADRQQIEAKELALIIGREVLSAFVELPRLIWRVAGGQVGSLTRRALQEAVGSDSRYRVLTDEDERVGESPEAQLHRQRADIERAIAAIMVDDDLAARVDPVPGEIWTSLIGETLGLIDGDPECAEQRAAAFGDAQFLPIDRGTLVGGFGRLPSGVRELAGVTGGTVDSHEVAAEAATEAKAATSLDKELPPPAPRESVTLNTSMPLGRAVHREIHQLELVRARWTRITAIAGTIRKNAENTFAESWPYDLSGSVLTIRFAAERAKYTARRAARADLTDALRRAIGQELGGAPTAIRVIVEGEEGEWSRVLTAAAFANLLEIDPARAVADLKKCGVAVTELDDTVSADQIRKLAADSTVTKKASALSKPLGELMKSAANLYFVDGARPVDAFARLMRLPVSASDEPAADAQPEVVLDITWDLTDPQGVTTHPDDGLLVRVRSAILRQVTATNQDIARLLGTLRNDQVAFAPLTIARSVPFGAGVGIILLIVRLGLSDRVVQLIQSQEVSVRTLDLLFTVSTLLIFALALFLTDIGKSLGEQTRAMVFGAGTVGIIAYVLLYFDRVRFLVSEQLRESSTFAVLLGSLTVGFVIYAALQSARSGSPLRVQGSRVMGGAVIIYAVVGFVFLQALPESWWGEVRLEDFGQRLDAVILVFALALITIAIIVITVIRLRESRRLDNSFEINDWALRALADAVETRAVLQLADRQWLATMPVLAQIIRQPFGPIKATGNDVDVLGASTVLKSASVRLTLNDRGQAALEARVRQELVSSSWLRVRYESLVLAFQEFLAARSAVPVSALDARRPEGDVSVPSVEALEVGTGPGDRMQFAGLVASGWFDSTRAEPIEQLDVARLFQPLLAGQDVQTLEGSDGRGETVRDYFGQVLPQAAARIPDGVVQTALAAGEEARRMRTFVWWPERMLGDAIVPADADVQHRATELFRRGVIGGAGLVAVRVDVSGEFNYSELVGAVTVAQEILGQAAETTGTDYEGTSGL